MTTDELQTGGVHKRPQGPAAGSNVTGEKLYAYDEAFARDLKARAVKGVAWSALARMGGQAIRFVVIIVLARLLLPEDFGLLGMAMVAIAFAGVFRDVGLGQAVIQRKELTEQQLSSVFWINLGVGVLLTGLLVVTSPWIASFYGRPDLVWILIFLSLNMVVTSTGQIPTSLFRRQLNFKILCSIDLATAVASGTVAISLAHLGFGVWSLVVWALLRSTLRTGALWLFTGWRPRLTISYLAVKPLLAFGLPLLGFGLVNYFHRNLDYLLIGKFLGAEQLGFYTLAYTMMLLPLSNISSSIAAVAFPAFSSFRDDKKRAARAYLKIARYISFVTFPMMGGLALSAPELIPVLVGEKWRPAVVLIQILAIVGALSSVQTTVGVLFNSQGRTRLGLKWAIFGVSCYVVGMIIGLRWGIIGLASGYGIAVLCTAPLCFHLALNLVGVGLKQLGVALFPAAAGSLVVCAALWLLRVAVLSQLGNDAWRLIFLVLVGIALYAGFSIFFQRKLVQEALRITWGLFGNMRPGEA